MDVLALYLELDDSSQADDKVIKTELREAFSVFAKLLSIKCMGRSEQNVQNHKVVKTRLANKCGVTGAPAVTLVELRHD